MIWLPGNAVVLAVNVAAVLGAVVCMIYGLRESQRN